MTKPDMVVAFRKLGRVCAWTALRPPRSVVPGPSMAAGGDLPHDLYTFVIEDALDIEYGFWGCVADGATFKTLGRKQTPQGKAVITRHLADLDAAEARVNDIYFVWRAGRTTELSDALDSMLARWRALGEADELELRWRVERATARRAAPHREVQRA